jgi:hypothetical protein
MEYGRRRADPSPRGVRKAATIFISGGMVVNMYWMGHGSETDFCWRFGEMDE